MAKNICRSQSLCFQLTFHWNSFIKLHFPFSKYSLLVWCSISLVTILENKNIPNLVCTFFYVTSWHWVLITLIAAVCCASHMWSQALFVGEDVVLRLTLKYDEGRGLGLGKELGNILCQWVSTTIELWGVSVCVLIISTTPRKTAFGRLRVSDRDVIKTVYFGPR